MKLPSILATVMTVSLAGMSANVAPSIAQSGPGNYGNVNTVYACSRDGDPINLRARPGQQNRVIIRVRPGNQIFLTGTARVVGGYTWQKVNYNGITGWVRGDFLCS